MADTCEHGMPIRMGCDDCTIGRLAADRDAFADAATEAQAERDAARDERDALTARVAELEAALIALRDGPGIECIPDNRVQDMIRALLSGKERT